MAAETVSMMDVIVFKKEPRTSIPSPSLFLSLNKWVRSLLTWSLSWFHSLKAEKLLLCMRLIDQCFDLPQPSEEVHGWGRLKLLIELGSRDLLHLHSEALLESYLHNTSQYRPAAALFRSAKCGQRGRTYPHTEDQTYRGHTSWFIHQVPLVDIWLISIHMYIT